MLCTRCYATGKPYPEVLDLVTPPPWMLPLLLNVVIPPSMLPLLLLCCCSFTNVAAPSSVLLLLLQHCCSFFNVAKLQCLQLLHVQNCNVQFGASVQLPTFDKIEPDSWFAVAEANFALRKVSDSTTKYYYVLLSKLDSDTLRKLSVFLKCPRGDDPYQELRETLCQAFEPALEQKLDTLLGTTDSSD